MSSARSSATSAVLAREWLVVLLAVVAAVAVAYLVSGPVSASYVAQGTVKLDAAVLSKYPTVLVGERTVDSLQSQEFFDFAAKETGIPLETLKSSLKTNATGKFLENVVVRYTADSEASARDGAAKSVAAVVAYAYSVAAPEIDRQREIVAIGDESVNRIKSLQDKFADNPYELASVEAQLTLLEQSAVTNKAALAALEKAYVAGDSVTASEAVGTSRIELLAAAALAGLVAGLAVAVVREYLLRRKTAA